MKSTAYNRETETVKKKENCSTEQKIYISLNINVNGHVTYEMSTLKGYFGLDYST